MVLNRRHATFITLQKIPVSKIAPYLLHVCMVLAVAAYVFLGAATIRAIEATEKNSNDPSRALQSASKSEKYWHSVHQQQRLAKNASRTSNTGESRSTNDISDANDSVNQKRIKRKAPLTRSRKCVTAALRTMSQDSKCAKEQLTVELMSVLDRCYEADLKSIVKRAHEGDGGPPPPPKMKRDVPTRTPVASFTEYEYWSWTDAILFCFTVITTIGYGNVAPKTLYGQLFVIIYGLFGVPFSMVVIANLGKFLAELLKAWIRPFRNLLKKVARCLCLVLKGARSPSNKEKQTLVDSANNNHLDVEPSEARVSFDGSEESYESEFEESSLHKDAASLFFAFALYIVFGSLIISSYEPDMDLFKAVYYIFVSLTTIGLGDVVPKSDSYLAFTLIYIAVGLALTTIAIEIASDYLKKLHYFGRKMENVGNVPIWFGSKKLTMKQLVKNLGDQFNLPVDEMHNLNLDQFVDNAIKVEQGELPSLRNSQYPFGIKPIFITDFKDVGNVIFADEDERYVIYNLTRNAYEKYVPPALAPNGVIPLLPDHSNIRHADDE